MSTTTLDWQVIGLIADRLGIRPETLKKWMQRGSVPHKWRIPIIKASRGRLSLDAFDDGKVGRSQSREGIPA